MIDGFRVIGVIPARGGSKSIPRKNLQEINNVPLIAWAIKSSLASNLIDRTIVSTDDEEIAKIAKEYGSEVYLRPDHLATDASLVADTIRHLRQQLRSEHEDGEIFVLLEPTAPLRPLDLIDNCLVSLVHNNLDSVATFHEIELNPERIWLIKNGVPSPAIIGSVPWKPRQELSKGYTLTGSVYAFFVDSLPDNEIGVLFGEIGAVVVESKTIDIDTMKDLEDARDSFNQ
jgi:CMP-N-acetylneuraminic acid synthetase